MTYYPTYPLALAEKFSRCYTIIQNIISPVKNRQNFKLRAVGSIFIKEQNTTTNENYQIPTLIINTPLIPK